MTDPVNTGAMRVRSRRWFVSVLAVAASTLSVACSGAGSTATSSSSGAVQSVASDSGVSTESSSSCASPASGKGTAVAVHEHERTFEPDTGSVKAGTTTFTITNTGPSTHGFSVFKTDLAPGKLPVTDGAFPVVDKTAPGVTLVDEIHPIDQGCTVSLTVDLEKGNYVMVCNLPNHYQVFQMYAPMKVT